MMGASGYGKGIKKLGLPTRKDRKQRRKRLQGVKEKPKGDKK